MTRFEPFTFIVRGENIEFPVWAERRHANTVARIVLRLAGYGMRP